MKKYLYLVSLGFLLIFFSSQPKALAIGVLEFGDNFPDSFHATVGSDFYRVINFTYSGTVSELGVTLTGGNLPAGLELGPIIYGVNGNDSIAYYGTPLLLGSYPIKIRLTDNYGATISKNFTLNIDGLLFDSSPLQNATLNSWYKKTIKYTYSGSSSPTIHISDISPQLLFSTSDIVGNNGSFDIKLLPIKTGNYSFKATASVGDINVGYGYFYLIVKDPSDVTVEQIPSITPVKPIVPAVVPVPPQKEIKTTIVSSTTLNKNTKNLEPAETTTVVENAPQIPSQVVTEPVKKPSLFKRILSWFKRK